MDKIILILSLACLAYIFVEHFIKPLKFLFKIKRRIKPFDCELCMGFWIGFIYFIIRDNGEFIYLAPLIAITTVWITNYTNAFARTSPF